MTRDLLDGQSWDGIQFCPRQLLYDRRRQQEEIIDILQGYELQQYVHPLSFVMKAVS